MRARKTPQSTTSLPQSPEEESSHRLKRYLLTMGIRTVCLILMAAITPYGWYTWVFAAATIFLPYIAVVMASVGGKDVTVGAERPDRAIEAPKPPSLSTAEASEKDSGVFIVHESRDDKS